MNIVNFNLDSIRRNSKYRPVGYFEDVISYGRIVGNYLELSEKNASLLVEKYYEKSPVIGIKSDPVFWGPFLWKEIHSRPKTILEIIKEDEERWIRIFSSWIPCGTCRNHFLEIISKNPPDFSSKENYYLWTVRVHNIVNQHLNKPEFIIKSSA